MAANCPRKSWQNINIITSKIFISFNIILSLIYHSIDEQFESIASLYPFNLIVGRKLEKARFS